MPLAARALRGMTLAMLILLPAPLRAVTPTLWTVDTFDDFERGKPDGVAVVAAGELVLAPGLKPLKVPPFEESAEPFLWSQAADSKGTLYVGGGNGGKIYRVPRGAAGALYYETGDLAVQALALDRSDVLYAATSPQGKIYRITGEAKGEVYYQPEDRYIWALAVGPKGDLYAATGEHGVVYRVVGKGKAETVFKSEEFHVVSLAFDASGNLYAGTDGKGLLYRISPAGKPTVVYDSPLREINALAVDAKGTVYAAAIGQEGEAGLPPSPQPQPTPAGRPAAQAGAPVPPPVALPGMEGGATATVTVTASASGPFPPPAGAPKSEVYRVSPDGMVETLWSSDTEVVYSLAIDSSGRPLAGTGEPGRVRVLSGTQQSTLLARLPESQVTSLVAGPGQQIFVATSNVGKVYALESAAGDSGSFVSPTRDARGLSRWGRISWRAAVPAGDRVELATRSGNSGVPDTTWSDWSPPYASPDGSPVASPPARFLQWRARLSRTGGAPSPTLSAVAVAYMQSNLPPLVKKITPQPPGVIRERLGYVPETDPQDLAFTGIRVNPESGETGGASLAQIPSKKIYARGMRAIEWDADDPNGDTLSFDLSFRAEGEAAWKPLARDLREPYFAFDSTQLPDGLYRVRVEASDAPSNPAPQAKTASLVSDPFLVDNTPPVVQVTSRKGAKPATVTIDASATDTEGPITRAEYSLDAARWVPVAPLDGVNDSRAESYSVTLEGLRPGEHTVIVKVTDLLGNTGAGKATFTSE